MIRSRHVVALATVMLLDVSLLAIQQPSPIRISDNDQEKKLIKKVEPIYRQGTQVVAIRGPVILEVVANEKGEVIQVKIVKGGNPALQQPVADAVKQWLYSPTYVDGKPVSVKFGVTVPIVFKK